MNDLLDFLKQLQRLRDVADENRIICLQAEDTLEEGGFWRTIDVDLNDVAKTVLRELARRHL